MRVLVQVRKTIVGLVPVNAKTRFKVLKVLM
jgi:hypothetical protein